MSVDPTTRAVVGHEGYAVSRDGRVFSERFGSQFRRELKPEATHDGYLRVNLRVPGTQKYRWSAVAPIVAAAFIGPRPEGQQVRHLNGRKTDNHASNLAYGTAQQNAADRDRHGTTVRGERSKQARHTDVQVREALRRIAAGESRRAVAASIGVSKTALNDWAAGRSRKSSTRLDPTVASRVTCQPSCACQQMSCGCHEGPPPSPRPTSP